MEDTPFCPWCGAKQVVAAKKTINRTRGNGAGTAFKRGNVWYARITLGYVNQNGALKRKYRTKGSFRTKSEALAYCAQLSDKPKRDSSVTFIGLFNEWLPGYEPTVGKTTVDGHKAALAYFNAIHFMKFADLVTGDFQACVDKCPKGKRTKENMKALITALYKHAMANDIVDKDYAKYISTGREKKGTREAFTLEEVARVRSAIGTIPYADYVYFMIYTGFRPGEMLALKKSAYDTSRNCLVGGSKTAAGTDRSVTLSPKLASILVDRMQAEGTYLFPKENGEPMDDEHFRKYCFNPLMNALGIVGRVPYSCRHTFANLLKNVTGSDTDKAALIGHADASMTKYYQSPDFDSLKRITDAL